MNYEHASGDIVTVDGSYLAYLVERAYSDPQHKYRLCLNPTAGDAIHEMVIVHLYDTIVPIHKHKSKSESFHFILGVANVLLYNDNGTLRETIRMGSLASNRTLVYRLNADIYHSLEILTPVIVFHECTNGPWHKEDMIIAPWWEAPKGWTR